MNQKESEFKNLFKHQTKKRVMIKFILLLAVLTGYMVFLSFKYGIRDGFSATALTWSFFVFCTPIADAGFLLDFPIRLITGIRMVYSEIIVWIIAATLNITALNFFPASYETTGLLEVFKKILLTPYPYWSIILLSCTGTFLSIYFGDELMDVIRHRERIKFKKHLPKYIAVVTGFLILITLIVTSYSKLIDNLGVNIFDIT